MLQTHYFEELSKYRNYEKFPFTKSQVKYNRYVICKNSVREVESHDGPVSDCIVL